MGAPFITRPEIAGSFGVVTATHWIAAQAGMRMLELGGNAFDAAAAAGFALQVVMPHMNGPGGEVPIILATADGAVEVICGQGVAPAAATIERFGLLGLDMIPGTGPLAAVVPGAMGGWLRMLLTTARSISARSSDRRSTTRRTVGPSTRTPSTSSARWRSCSAAHGRFGTGLAGRRQRSGAGGDRREPSPRGNIRAAAPSGAGRLPRAADRGRARGVLRGLRRRGYRPVLPARGGARQLWTAPPRPPDRGGHGDLAGERRAAAHGRLSRAHGMQDRAMGTGAGDAPAAEAAGGLRSFGARPERRRVRPSLGRGSEARLRGPRCVLRRPRLRGRSPRRAVERGVRRRPSSADRPRCLGGAAAGRDSRPPGAQPRAR